MMDAGAAAVAEMRQHRDELAMLLVWEIGKPWKLACADVIVASKASIGLSTMVRMTPVSASTAVVKTPTVVPSSIGTTSSQ